MMCKKNFYFHICESNKEESHKKYTLYSRKGVVYNNLDQVMSQIEGIV